MKGWFLKLLVFILLITACIAGALIGLRNYTNHNESVVVPPLSGLSLAAMKEKSATIGLRCVIDDSVYVSKTARNTIVQQLPVAGTLVKPGRTLHITVASSTPTGVQLPEVLDINPLEATSRLDAVGLKTDIVHAIVDTFPVVLAVKQEGKTLKAGDFVAYGSTIELTIGIQ